MRSRSTYDYHLNKLLLVRDPCAIYHAGFKDMCPLVLETMSICGHGGHLGLLNQIPRTANFHSPLLIEAPHKIWL